MKIAKLHWWRAAAALGLMVPTAAWGQSTVWSLQECTNEALRNAPRLRAGAYTVESAGATASESEAARWPSLAVSGNYSYTSKTQTLQFDLPIPNFTMPAQTFGDGKIYDFALTARAPLFSGGSVIEKVRADASAYRAAVRDLAADSLALIYEVRRTYYGALGSDARAEAARQNVKRLQRHLDELAAAQAIGLMSEENRVAALARLRQAESAVCAAEAATQAARLALGNLIGRPGEATQPEGDLNAALTDSVGPAAIPVNSRAEVVSLTSRIEQSQHLTRAVWGSLLPSLSGSAAYHYGKPGVDMIKNEWMDYYTLGLNATWTLWDWNSRNHRTSAARASRMALEARKSDLVNAIRTREETAREALQLARTASQKAGERTDLERRHSSLVEGRLKNGMASESEYLDALDDLTSAEIDLAVTTAQLRLAEVDLLYARGR